MFEPLLLHKAFLLVPPSDILVDQLVNDPCLENLHLCIKRVPDHISSVRKNGSIECEQDTVHGIFDSLCVDQVMTAHRPDFCPHHPDLLVLELFTKRFERSDSIRLDDNPFIGEPDMNLRHLFLYLCLDFIAVAPDHEERRSCDHSFQVRRRHFDTCSGCD